MTRERWPKDPPAWRRRKPPPMDPRNVLSLSAWQSGPIVVLSALELAEPPDKQGDPIPQWHISVADVGKRPGPKHVRRALRAFGLVGAEEDNHHPGTARHFWMPVDPARRVACECKADEDVIVEPDGHRWTNPREGEGPCRGCSFEKLSGKPCPLHGSAP